MFKKLLVSFAAVAAFLLPVATQATTLFPTGGGTGSTTLSGILIGNGVSPVNTLTIGSGLTLTGTTLTSTGGGSSTFGTTSIFATTPLQWNTTTATLSILQAGTSQNGYLSSTDWNTFNNKQPAGNYATFSYPFPLLGLGTSTGLMILGSSTIGNGTQTGGLTINGGATTTGTLTLPALTQNSIPFIGAGGAVSQDTSFTYTASNKHLDINGPIRFGTGAYFIGNTSNGFVINNHADTANLIQFYPSGCGAIGTDYAGNGADCGTNNFIVEGKIGIATTTPYKTFSVGGDVAIGASTAGGTNGNLFLNQLATAAGSFLAVDTNGKVIATTTPSGGGSSFGYPFPSNATTTLLTLSGGIITPTITGNTSASLLIQSGSGRQLLLNNNSGDGISIFTGGAIALRPAATQNIDFTDGVSGNSAIWDTSLLTTNRTYTLPDTTGTLCLTTTCTGTVTGVTASAPLFSSGGTAPNIRYTGLATTSQPASSNILTSNGSAGVYGTATTSVTCTGNATCSSFTVLGNTPVTINGASGTAASSTLLGDSNTFSGNNSFTQLITGSISGNAGTATKFATGRTIAITGDLTYTSPSFDGSSNVTAAGTLATVNASPGTFTNATLTVNGKGLVTSASNGTAPVTAVTASYPLASSGGVTPNITTNFSTTTNNGMAQGFLYSGSGGIWQTAASSSLFGFTPQPAGNYITALTGDVTASGPGSVAATLATVNSNTGTFTYPSVTVNGKGLITAISNGTAPTTYTGTFPIQVTGSVISSLFSTTSNSGMAQGFNYVGSGGIFQTAASSSLFGFTPLNPTRNINTTAPLTGGGALTSDLTLGCASCSTFAWPFTPQTWGNSTTSALSFNGFISSASSTLSYLAGTAAGSFIAVDATGKIIATSTPTGGTGSGAVSIPVQLATTGALPANTYAGGVLTEVGTGALTVDSTAAVVGNRILVKNEAAQTNNGIYSVTAAGSGIAAYVLTRVSDYNSSSNVIPGEATYVIGGSTLSDDWWALTTVAPITVGGGGSGSNLTYVETNATAAGVTSLAGTTNQITASASTGAITLSLPNHVIFPTDYVASAGSTTNATSTNFAIVGAAANCNGSNALTTNSSGVVGCTAQPQGTLTSIAVATANGFAGSSSGGATPSLTLTTTITGLLKGNGTAISAAALTDFPSQAANTVIANGTGISAVPTAVGTSTLFGTPTPGTILAFLNGQNTFVATTTFSSGLTYLNGNVTNTGVTSNVAGTGISVSGATGAVTVSNTGVISNSCSSGISCSGTNPSAFTNTGVTSIVAGTNVTISGATGAVTINATSGGSSFAFPWTPTNNFGINTNATSTTLSLFAGLNASSTSHIASTTFAANGFVGFGTSTPEAPVTFAQTGGLTQPDLIIDGVNGLTGAEMELNRGSNTGTEEANIDFNTNGTEFWQFGMQNNSSNDFELWDGNDDPAFTIKTSTNAIGFGTTTPYGDFAINADFGDAPGLIFNVASSSQNATTSVFAVSSGGQSEYAAGTAGSPAITFIQDLASGIFQASVGTLSFVTAGVEKARILANGNFGIGTTTPQWVMDVASSTKAQFALTSNSTNGNFHWTFNNVFGNLFLATSSDTTFATSTNSDPNTGFVEFPNNGGCVGCTDIILPGGINLRNGQYVSATSTAAFAANTINDIYTSPPGKRTFVMGAILFHSNQTLSSNAASYYLKDSGNYYRLTATSSTLSLPSDLPIMYVLEPGESIAAFAPAAGLSISLNMIQYSSDVPLRSVFSTSATANSTTTLYQVPAGRSAMIASTGGSAYAPTTPCVGFGSDPISVVTTGFFQVPSGSIPIPALNSVTGSSPGNSLSIGCNTISSAAGPDVLNAGDSIQYVPSSTITAAHTVFYLTIYEH